MRCKHIVVLFTSLTAASLLLVNTAAAGGRAVATFDGVPLSFLVNKFNLETAADARATGEPKITEEEVVAAIYAWKITHAHDITEETFAIYQKIAETGKLPKDSALDLCRAWTTQQRHYDVWWVDLVIKTGEDRVYVLRVRERLIRSRPQAGRADIMLDPAKN